MSSADPALGAARAGRLRRLVLGAGLAIGDHVAAVVDDAAARVEADELDDLLTGADAPVAWIMRESSLCASIG